MDGNAALDHNSLGREVELRWKWVKHKQMFAPRKSEE